MKRQVKIEIHHTGNRWVVKAVKSYFEEMKCHTRNGAYHWAHHWQDIMLKDGLAVTIIEKQ